MSTLPHSCSTSERSASPSAPFNSCLSRRRRFHNPNHLFYMFKPKCKRSMTVVKLEAAVARTSTRGDMAMTTDAPKSVILSTEAVLDVTALRLFDSSKLSESDFLKVQRVKLSEMERSEIDHDQSSSSCGNYFPRHRVMGGTELKGLVNMKNVDNVAVRSKKRTERLMKRKRASAKSRNEVAEAATTESYRKCNRSKKAYLHHIQVDPIRSFLIINGSQKRELLTAAEEIQLSLKIQDFLLLENVKETLQKQKGRQPTLSEWANAASMKVGPFSRRLKEGRQSKDKMIQCNLRLVISVARKYEGRGLSIEDLVQAGSKGLIRGCEKFDPNRGFKFCTYAYWWIKQAVMRAIFENCQLIRLPAHVVDVMLRVGRVKRALLQKDGNPPSEADIANHCGISLEKLRVIKRASRPCKSLDKPVRCDVDMHWGDVIPDTSLEAAECKVARDLLRENLNAVLMTLNPREEAIMRLRFGLDDGKKRTLAEIAKKFDVTRERIRQLECRALRKIKTHGMIEWLRGEDAMF